MSRLTRTTAVLGGLALLILGLHAAAQLDLRGPTGVSRAELETWLMDPVSAIATVLRWVALVLSYYLAGVVLALSFAGDRLETSPARVLIPHGLASAVGLLLGAGAVAVPLVGHMSAQDPIAGISIPERLQLRVLEEPLTLETIAEAPLEPLGGREHPLTAPAATPPLEARRAQNTWTVEPGDSFWKIAEEELRDAWGRDDLTDAEVDEYWRTLIAQNMDRLVEPGNPDLLFPGQKLMLPKVPPARR